MLKLFVFRVVQWWYLIRCGQYWMGDTVGTGGGNCGDAGVGTSLFKVELNCWLQEQGGFSPWPENLREPTVG